METAGRPKFLGNKYTALAARHQQGTRHILKGTRCVPWLGLALVSRLGSSPPAGEYEPGSLAASSLAVDATLEVWCLPQLQLAVTFAL